MSSSSGYRPVRSASPFGNDWDTDDHELEDRLQEDEEDVLPSDRLLCKDEEADDGWADKRLPRIPRSRHHSTWLVCLLIFLGFVSVGLLVVFPLLLFHREPEDNIWSDTFRTRSSDYVLGPDWDFKAPSQVREYNWVIRQIEANPDGVFRPMLTVNGKFPGELIRCNEGDTIVVNVENRGVNATAIHFHGVFQNGTNHMDGVPGVTQCPIAPGGKFRYEFTIKGQSGTYFYHGHQAAQGLDGLVGPIVVHARDERETVQIPYASDRVVMLQDWYYDLSSGLLKEKLSPGSESAPIPNGALINGRNKVDCSTHPQRRCDSSTASFASFDLQPNEQHRLRILNVGAYAWFEVTVDEHHDLPIVEIDGTAIEPSSEASLLVGPGQRYSVLLSANQTGKDVFWFRARMLKHCFSEYILPEGGFEEAKAAIHYASSAGTWNSEDDVLPITENDSGEYAVECRDMATRPYKPYPAKTAPEYAHHSWYLRVNIEIGDWRLERGVLNTSSFRPQLSSPTLHRVIDGLASRNKSFGIQGVNIEAFDSKHELVISHEGPETVDVILQNFDEGNHPFHLHGHQFWVLGAGHGYFPGYEHFGLAPEGKGLLDPTNTTTVANPVRRDVATVEGFGWTLVRFVADNPGIWIFHCHMIWHGETGMAMQFVSRLDMLRNWTVPAANADLCKVDPEVLRKGAAPDDSIWYDYS